MIADSASPDTISDQFGRFLAASSLLRLSSMAYEPTQQRARILALQSRAFQFTCGVIKAYPSGKYLDEPSRIVWRELIKSATSSTFNLEEADAATSDSDFVAKMRISTREAKEAHVAIRLITACGLEGALNVAKFQDEANQLASIYSTIVRNKKANMKATRSAKR